MTKKEKKPKADDACSTSGSQQRGVNRRQFATNTGVLLGILAVGEPALGQAPVADAGGTSTGPWDNPALAKFREWDPQWIEQCLKMSGDPWTSGVLPRKDVELISLAVNAACTTLSPEGTRRHVRRNTPAHPDGSEARRDDGRDQGRSQNLCRPGYPGEQSRRPDPGRGTREKAEVKQARYGILRSFPVAKAASR